MTDEEILALWSITADEIAHARSKDGAASFYREDCRIAFARAVAARERERCAKACEAERIEGSDLVADKPSASQQFSMDIWAGIVG